MSVHFPAYLACIFVLKDLHTFHTPAANNTFRTVLTKCTLAAADFGVHLHAAVVPCREAKQETVQRHDILLCAA